MSAGNASANRFGAGTSDQPSGPLVSDEARELHPEGLTEDGRYLLLAAADDRGRRFRVRADERLRGMVRGATGRPGQHQPRQDSALTPREIQARLRSGETASDVARAAGIPLERILRYEGPVLAERARVVDEARAGRPPARGEEPRRTLGEIVDERLAGMDIREEAVQWDAWRRLDGTWTVQMVYPADGEATTAQWVFDPPVRRVRPHNDEGAALLAPIAAAAVEGPPAAPSAAAAPAPVPPAPTPTPAPAPAPPVSPAPPAAADVVPLALVPNDQAVPGKAEESGPAGPRPTRSGRKAVPAWDDIVFGTSGG